MKEFRDGLVVLTLFATYAFAQGDGKTTREQLTPARAIAAARHLRDQLNDPDSLRVASFLYYESSPPDGHFLCVIFRAKNEHGGLVLQTFINNAADTSPGGFNNDVVRPIVCKGEVVLDATDVVKAAVAIVSDIHGNLTAFEAVLNDLRQTAPDLIFHGGDLADGGASPAETVDHIRDLGWPGVVGNTDEMLFRPESLTQFAQQSPKLQPMFAIIEEMAAATRAALGEERINWLSSLPRTQFQPPIALVHATLESLWRAPTPEAPGDELQSTYAPLEVSPSSSTDTFIVRTSAISQR
jgi:hypothetical protein